MHPEPAPSRTSSLLTAGDATGQLRTAARTGASCVVLDLAGLPADRKDTARAEVIAALETVDYGESLVTVRVNPIATMWAYRDVVDVLERAGEFVDCVAVADIASPGDVEFVDTLAGMIEHRIDLAHPIGIEAEIAGAAGLVLLDEVVVASDRLEAVVLDEAGVATALGAPDPRAPGVVAALAPHRLAVLTAARAAGLEAVLDPVVERGDRDEERGRDTTADTGTYHARIADARTLGYDGARCSHPTQVKAATTVFGQQPRAAG